MSCLLVSYNPRPRDRRAPLAASCRLKAEAPDSFARAWIISHFYSLSAQKREIIHPQFSIVQKSSLVSMQLGIGIVIHDIDTTAETASGAHRHAKTVLLQSQNVLQIAFVEPEGLSGHPASVGKLVGVFRDVADFGSVGEFVRSF